MANVYEGWEASQAIKGLRPLENCLVRTPNIKVLAYAVSHILGSGHYDVSNIEGDLYLVTRLK